MFHFIRKIIKGQKLICLKSNIKLDPLKFLFIINPTMELWLKISLQLSIFGFLKEFRPSEPFIFEFLTGPWRNLTETDITTQVFPVGTYSYLTFLIVMFLITDFCRYKPLIVLLGVCGIIIWSLFLWTTSLVALQIAEVFYGLANATEVAYYTYMYAKVSKEHYQQVTSHARAGALIGRFLAAMLSQVMISSTLMNYRELNFLSLTALSLSAVWALTLPSVPKSIYFNQVGDNGSIVKTTYSQAFSLLWQHFTTSYSSWHVIKWSIWWALATCGYTQVCVYIQNFWGTIVGDDQHQIYNGAVEASLTILSATAALAAGVLTVDWSKYGELTLGVCTMLAGSVILAATIIQNIWLSYCSYVIFGTLYQLMITVATSEVAKKLMDDSYGLVFGINTFLALLMQSLLTFVTITSGFKLNIYNQYLVYGGGHILLGFVFGVIGMYTLCKAYRRNTKNSYNP